MLWLTSLGFTTFINIKRKNPKNVTSYFSHSLRNVNINIIFALLLIQNQIKMKRVFFMLLLVFLASCSKDDDLSNSCTCYIYQPRTNDKFPTNQTDCSYDGRVISQAIGTKYICE